MILITALMIRPGEQPCVSQVLDDADFLNAAVSYGADMLCTAAAVPVERGIIAIYAWEGVMAGLPGNRKVGKRILAGTFYIVREISGNLYSLTPDDISRLSFRFRKIKEYSDDDVINSWFDGLWLAT